MPIRSSVTGSAAVVSGYPKLMQGPSGSVWLMKAEKQGTLVHKGTRAVEAIGYTSAKLSARKLTPFVGELKLSA